MYSTVAVAIDPAHPEHAVPLLKKAHGVLSEGGKLVAIAVVESPPAYVEAQLPPDVLEAARTRAYDTVKTAIDDPSVELRLSLGVPATAILDEAMAIGADLVIVASHKPGALDYLLGSTAARVVRHAPVSVLVMR